MAGSARLQRNDRIGHYRIESELATDSSGITYRALHQVLPRRAVIKVMHAASVYPRVIQQPLAVHVLREACILEALHHPGITRLFESGLLDDRRPWFAREFVEGPTVASVIGSSTDRADSLAILRDLAEVIDHAYRRGVIHCGLRPDRVILTGRSRGFPMCVTEWTDARLHDAAPMPFVPTGPSWHYTSPELAYGDPIDDRTDVFAFGVIAYQVLSGNLPFEHGAIPTDNSGTMQHVATEIACPDLPRELAGLVDQMLAYDRWDRPSIAEVYADLAWLADALSTPVSRGRVRQVRWTPNLSFNTVDDALSAGHAATGTDPDDKSRR
jgi:serine/threonine protein kinase